MDDFEIRKGVQSDCTEIRRLIQVWIISKKEKKRNVKKIFFFYFFKELAEYQKMPNGPKIDAKGTIVYSF